MFERYTEKARRVVFFARYEAGNYGSRYIETEHLLLGLLREDCALVSQFIEGSNLEAEIRAEIEKRISPQQRFSVSVEIPVTAECKRIFNYAAEESERLAQRHVGTEHLLLGMLREKGSLAAQVLNARGLRPEKVREQLAKGMSPTSVKAQPSKGALLTLDSFLAGLNWHKSEELVHFFAKNAQFVDVYGKRWNHEEIHKEFETLFAPYAKKNATYAIEETLGDTTELFVAIVLWKNAILASLQRVWIHRMSVVLIPEGDDWEIVLVQVTPVQPS